MTLKLGKTMKVIQLGDAKMRYPGGDPENGPAYLQVFDGVNWHCASHRFEEYKDCDPETGIEFTFTCCRLCGEYSTENLHE